MRGPGAAGRDPSLRRERKKERKRKKSVLASAGGRREPSGGVRGRRHGGGTGGCLAERSCGRGLPLAGAAGAARGTERGAVGLGTGWHRSSWSRAFSHARFGAFFRKSGFSSVPFFLVFSVSNLPPPDGPVFL